MVFLLLKFVTHKNFLHLLRKIKLFFYNVIAPPACNFCGLFLKQRLLFCSECAAHIQPVVSTTIEITKKYSLKVFAVSSYKDPLKKLVLAKHWGCSISCKQLAQLMAQNPSMQLQNYDYIIPIPLHWMRQAKRGFNQSYEMAMYLQKKYKIVCRNILKRNRHTQLQSNLTHDQRLKNVKHAFSITSIDRARYKNKHLLLIDDVMTTGATLHAAAHELIKLKPASITAIVACRAL